MPQKGKMAKMGRTNRKAVEWLKREGFIVDIIPHTRWSKDLFGIADAVAIKNGDVWFIQFKSNSWGNLKIYEDFFSKHNVNIMVIMIKDRKSDPFIRIWSRIPKSG